MYSNRALERQKTKELTKSCSLCAEGLTRFPVNEAGKASPKAAQEEPLLTVTRDGCCSCSSCTQSRQVEGRQPSGLTADQRKVSGCQEYGRGEERWKVSVKN